MTPHRIMMTTDTVGGVWVYATGLARRLAREGVQVTLVTLGPQPNAAKADELKSLAPNVELVVTDLALEWQDPEGSDIGRARSTLLRLADQVRPDLVHINGFREAALDWSCLSLVVAHSCVWSWWNATRGEWPAEPQWSTYRHAVSAGLDAADAWAAPTAAFRDMVQELYQPVTPGWVIPNGIDAPSAGDAIKKPVILASGRVWDGGKNLLALAQTAGELPWPVEIAGAGNPDDPVMLNVRWLGEIDHRRLQRHMRHAAVYAAPALYEPFGLGILEAANAGCALVLSDIASLRELWDGAALFVPPDDPGRLREALIRVCTDQMLCKRLQRAAVTRARRYSLDRTLAGCLEVYSAIAAQAIPRASTRQEALA